MPLNDDLKIKLITMAAGGAAAFVISKIVDATWTAVTGDQPPADGDDDTNVLRLVTFAGLSAMAVALGRHYAVRQTNQIIAARGLRKKK